MPLPDPILERVGGIVVVRDDLIPGGTKRRVLDGLYPEAGELVYASPAQGYAQVALAYSAAATGRRATVFVARRAVPHPRTAEAASAGARIVPVAPGYLTVVQARARAYCAASGAALLPFGLDTPEVLAALAETARSIPYQPAEVWCVAGSGLLSRALQLAWPAARHYAVAVGRAPDAGGAQVLRAPEPFERDAREAPPFPSCPNYDAKAWRFIMRQASPGAVFWNVAG